MIDERALSEKLTGNLFLIQPQDVECEFCGHSQKVPLPVRVTEVRNGLVKVAGGFHDIRARRLRWPRRGYLGRGHCAGIRV